MKRMVLLTLVLILTMIAGTTAYAAATDLYEDEYMYINVSVIPEQKIAMIKANLKITADQYAKAFQNDPTKFVDAMNSLLGDALNSDEYTLLVSIVTNDDKVVYEGLKGTDVSWLLEYESSAK